MTMQTQDEQYYSSARRDLIPFIPENCKRLLEAGCGSGATGAAIREQFPGIELVGIEFVEPMARKAGAHFDQVLCIDVEELDLPFEDGYFDCLIYGDVLEHLVDPWSVLKKHCRKLKPGGTAIVSIPNVYHYRIRKMLDKGQWAYRDSGIMDRTHLRFFTKTSGIELLEQAGLKVERVERIIGGSRNMKFFNRILCGMLDDGLTEQYIFVARKD